MKQELSRTYRIWVQMRARCRNPNNTNYPKYGGRGITVCDRWGRFENFLADMGAAPDELSLDRINNNGNYEPGNCRWATQAMQMQNTRANVFTPESAANVRAMLECGISVRRTAKTYRVCTAHIRAIRDGRMWKL